ncbi:MAG: universal stress protein [Bacteroidota bacterium]
MKTILFPTDFSPRSFSALKQASLFFKKNPLKFIVYHAYQQPFSKTDSNVHMAGLLENKERSLKHAYQNLIEDFQYDERITFQFISKRGLFEKEFLATTKNIDFDLVCMATKGAKGLDELWGTKTAKMIKEVNSTMLVIPDNGTFSHINRAVLVCDYSEKVDYDALDFFAEILREHKLHIDVITVNQEEKKMTASEKAYRQLVKKKMQGISANFLFTSHEDLDRGILQYCKDRGVGLVAVLNKKYGFLTKVFHESLTEKMAFKSHIPLLVLN